MTGEHYIATDVSASKTVKAAHGIVRAVYVTKAGAAGSKLELRNGTVDGAPLIFTVFGESVQDLEVLNTRFPAGIRATLTTGGNYIVVYE